MSEASPWKRVETEVAASSAEEVAVFLADLTGCGVECRSAAGGGATPRERVIGYVDGGTRGREQEERLRSYFDGLRRRAPGSDPRILSVTPQPEEDWLSLWKKHFTAVEAAPGLIVKPPWAGAPDLVGAQVIEIDPGMAFGTGLHATTRLMLGLMKEVFESAAASPRRVLDIGTGTGILALAAALFGAGRVLAIDSDPRAVEAAVGNVARNGLSEAVEVSGEALSALNESFDMILANIVHDTLAALVGDVTAKLARPGIFLCSGLLHGPQTESIRAAYEGAGLVFTRVRREGEWAAMVLEHKK